MQRNIDNVFIPEKIYDGLECRIRLNAKMGELKEIRGILMGEAMVQMNVILWDVLLY